MSDLTPDDMSQPSSGPEADDPSTDVSGPSSSVPVDPDPTIAEVDATVIDDLEGDPVLDLMGVLEAERDSYLADLQRVSAEFANFRKQANRRNAEATIGARADLAGRLLPILDACDAAISQGADDVVAIRKAMLDALEPVGLEVLDPNGDPFDPTLHEAVAHEPADRDDDVPEVVEVVRRGYVWAGRVLRPAMVRVRG